LLGYEIEKPGVAGYVGRVTKQQKQNFNEQTTWKIEKKWDGTSRSISER
jgi:hypothetical protein